MPEDYSSIFPEQKVAYASFWERFAAAFLDGIILMVVNFFVSLLFEDEDYYGDFVGIKYNLTGSFVQIIIGWLYAALQESSPWRATLGKRALGIQVTGLQGDRISFIRATGRHFGKLISMIILFVGYLMMIWDDKKQTLHDKMAGTLVIRK